MKGKDFLVSNPNVFRKSFKAGDTDFMPNSLTSEATETVLRDLETLPPARQALFCSLNVHL